ncbi:lipase maturation factor family protein [Microbacterium sp. 179-B 1A2 NHS]|uniref:lipase maturation factor family protein n=1 Tax=Microbacterium sp. 179-B 1A2 NHS TaxID=3142383 RepID=UPI00399FC3F0
MDGFAAVDFEFARQVLQRGIAVLYVVAFVSSFRQFPALLGERGLLPAPRLLEWARHAARTRRLLRPTVFTRIRFTDRRLRILCAGGATLGVLLVAGVPQAGPPWVPMLCFLALWFGYMSIVSIGQTFYGFGWEMLLLEAGFLVAFLGSDDQPPPTVVIVLLWWLLFRLEFGAGMIKIRGGREWRDLTAMAYHHETQPMPGPLSRQAHLLPRWFHRAEVVGNHVAQLLVPWLLFAPLLSLWVPGPWPLWVGAGAGAVIIGTQLWLVLTGNFAWLNVATIVLAFSAVGLPASGHPTVTDPPWVVQGLPLAWLAVTAALGAVLVVVSVPAARNLVARRQLMNASFNRWQLGNAYGAFGTVTQERIEYIIEGTRDADPDTADWQEYGFHGKPGDVRRRPPQVAPYHLRLDWLMWFLPLGPSLEDWFAVFLTRLLNADAATLALLRDDPFDGEPPRWIRVVGYRYRFATRTEGRQHGVHWMRESPRVIVPPLTRRG